MTYDKNDETFCGHGKFDVVVDIFKTLVSMDHFANDASVFWQSFMWTQGRHALEIHLIPDTDPNLFYHTRSCPTSYHNLLYRVWLG